MARKLAEALRFWGTGGWPGKLGVALLWAVCAVWALPACAADLFWSAQAVRGISQRGVTVSQQFKPRVLMHPNARITLVHVQRDLQARVPVQTRLCAGAGGGQCMDITGSGTSTRFFQGLPADQVFYLTHVAPGQGNLTPPVFVRVTLTVWYDVAPEQQTKR